MMLDTYYELVNTKDVKIRCSALPEPYSRVINPFDSKEIAADKKEYPYKSKVVVDFDIITPDKAYSVKYEQYKNDDDGFKYNGASIPKLCQPLIGEPGNLHFLIPAYFHDILCNHKYLINYDRKLSSVVFKELLSAYGVGKIKAYTMYKAVDLYQMLPFNGWNKRDLGDKQNAVIS